MSLFIPNTGVLDDKDEIFRQFDSRNIGRVSYVKFYPKTDKNGKHYNSANIYFAEWYETTDARELQIDIQNATRDKPVRLFYKGGLDWILLENTRTKTEPLPLPAKVYQDTRFIHLNRPNDFAASDVDYESDIDYQLRPLVRQKTPMIESREYSEEFEAEEIREIEISENQEMLRLEIELDESRSENENLHEDIKTIIEELDENYRVDILICEQEIDTLRRRIFELEVRNRHLEELVQQHEPELLKPLVPQITVD